jgi:hypothetical protein
MTVQSLLNDLFSEFSDSTKQPQRDSHEVRPDDVHQSGDPERIQDHHRRKLPDHKPVKQIDGGMEGRNQDAQAATDSARSEGGKAEPIGRDLSRIREWCVRIGETDEDAIAEVLDLCRTDPEARAYYLCRATETEPGAAGAVRCADCKRKVSTEHPVLTLCGAGIQAPGACGMWWSTAAHVCSDFEAAA